MEAKRPELVVKNAGADRDGMCMAINHADTISYSSLHKEKYNCLWLDT